MKKKIKFKEYFLLLLLLLSFMPLFDLFYSGLPITHDGQDHVARIANFYQNLKEGNIIPRWAGNLNWGYGHPILQFLYPLPSYIASTFHFLGFSLIDSIKIVFGLGMILSGVFMYIWLLSFLGRNAALLGAFLYMFAPYRFVDLYVRGAIGEHVSFVFPPLILFFIFKLSKAYSFWYLVGCSVSIAGLILSHNAITLMFLPFIFAYGIYMISISKNGLKLLYQYICIMVLGLGLASFFWIPAFFEGKYTLRDIVTAKDYSSHFVNFREFIYGPWSYGGSKQLSMQIGIVHWIVLILGIPATVSLYKKKNKLWILGGLMFTMFFLALFIMSESSLFLWNKITTLQKFQFPWRFLTLTVFSTSVLGAFVIFSIPSRLKTFLTIFLLILILILNRNYWHAKGFLQKGDVFFEGVYKGTTDTGESAPIWSVRFMEKVPKANMESIEGETQIIEIKRTSTVHEYRIISKERSRVRENTLYFPGWNIFVNSKKVDIEFQDPLNRGLMTFFIDKGTYDVLVKFEETKLRMVANAISILSLLFVIILGILKRISIWRHFR